MANRIMSKIRKNVDFLAIQRVCTKFNLEFEVVAPTGKGHPRAVITDGTNKIKYPISITPSHSRPENVEHNLMSRLRERAMIPHTSA